MSELQIDLARPDDGLGLSADLIRLAELKARRDVAKMNYDDAESEYKALESRLVGRMLGATPPLLNVRLRGVGTFWIGQRRFLKVTDLRRLLDWAQGEGLSRVGRIDQLRDEVTMTFDLVETASRDGTPGLALMSGVFRCDVAKAALNSHVDEITAGGAPFPPGLEQTSTDYINIRRR